jgi:hypothetical protein
MSQCARHPPSSQTGRHQKISGLASVAQHLDVVDLDGARDLNNRLVEETVEIGILPSEPAKVHENANVTA